MNDNSTASFISPCIYIISSTCLLASLWTTFITVLIIVPRLVVPSMLFQVWLWNSPHYWMFSSFLLLCLVPSFARPMLACRYASPRPATAWYFLTSYKTLWLSPFPDMYFYVLINVLWLLVYWIVTSISLTSHFITIILHFVCFACFQTLKSLILNLCEAYYT